MPKKAPRVQFGLASWLVSQYNTGIVASNDIRNILTVAEHYAAKQGLSLSTVSLYAAGQGRLLDRLRDGWGITVRRRDRIMSWFSNHWPSDLAWPSDIPRPEPSKKEAA